MISVALLFDNTNNWLSEYIPEYLCTSQKFNVTICYDEKEVRGFDLVFVLGFTKLLKGEILYANKLFGTLAHKSRLAIILTDSYVHIFIYFLDMVQVYISHYPLGGSLRYPLLPFCI